MKAHPRNPNRLAGSLGGGTATGVSKDPVNFAGSVQEAMTRLQCLVTAERDQVHRLEQLSFNLEQIIAAPSQATEELKPATYKEEPVSLSALLGQLDRLLNQREAAIGSLNRAIMGPAAEKLKAG